MIRLLQLHRTVVCQDSDLPDELLYGRAGYLYALLYLNTEIGPGTVCESAIKEVRWVFSAIQTIYAKSWTLLLGGTDFQSI